MYSATIGEQDSKWNAYNVILVNLKCFHAPRQGTFRRKQSKLVEFSRIFIEKKFWERVIIMIIIIMIILIMIIMSTP